MRRGFQQQLRNILAIARQRGLLKDCSPLVAIDSTGLESRHVSHYYGRRTGLRMPRFPKVSAVCDTRSHLFLAAVANRGPHSDHVEFGPAATQAYRNQPFAHLVADAGYDAESNHHLARSCFGARSTIAARQGRPSEKLPTGAHRREMVTAFDQEAYRQRWQVESAFSQFKRRLGSALRARRYWSQCRETLLRLLVHNLMIIRRQQIISTEQAHPYFP